MTGPISNDPKVPVIKTGNAAEFQAVNGSSTSITAQIIRDQQQQQILDAQELANSSASPQAKRRNLGNLGNKV